MNIDELVGQRIRELRGAKTQDQVAAEARSFGLDWTRNVVAAIELGGRQLSAGEFSLLPLLLQRVTGKRVELADLFPDNRTIIVGGSAAVPSATLRKVYRGRAIDAHIHPRAVRTRAQMAADDEQREAERKAAAKLGIRPAVLSLAARLKYGMSFSDARDARLRDKGHDIDRLPARSLQALRGHETRAMLKELEPTIERADAVIARPPKKGKRKR